MAGTDNGDGVRGQELGFAESEEQQRRIKDFAEALGIAWVVKGDELRAAIQGCLLLFDRIFERTAARDAAGVGRGDSGGLQFRGGGAKNGLGRFQFFEEPESSEGAETGDHAESEPVKRFLLRKDGSSHVKGVAEKW